MQERFFDAIKVRAPSHLVLRQGNPHTRPPPPRILSFVRWKPLLLTQRRVQVTFGYGAVTGAHRQLFSGV